MVISHQQFQQLLKLILGNSVQKEEEYDSLFSGMITCGAVESTTQEWIVDSGASDHMTCSLKLLHNFRPAPSYLTIKLPTGNTVNITYIGDMVLKCGITLINVLFVPQFTHNLLSVTKLGKNNDCEVTFKEEKCIVMDTKSKAVMGVGFLKNSLYYLSDVTFLDNRKKNVCNTMSQSCEASSHTGLYTFWHNRLGHISNSKLKLIHSLKSLTFPQSKVCLTCPLSQFTKMPYTLSNLHASQPFELVHIDTWGPYKVCAKQKYRYFFTLVDDNSRMTWIYLLQNKSDYRATLQIFYEYFANHFNSSIKTMGTDNALEFSDQLCTKFMKKYGIVHQTTCSHGLNKMHVSRGNIDTCWMWLELSNSNLAYLILIGEIAFLHLHTSSIEFSLVVLNNISPHEKLFRKASDYNELIVFGCMDMATPLGVTTVKFKPKALHCIFVGYPTTKRGYKLLTLNSRTSIVLRDVPFHEHIFPLLDGALVSYSQPVPTNLQRKPPKLMTFVKSC